MNAMLNINIRVASAAAEAQLKRVEGQLNRMNMAAGRGATGGMGAFNKSLGLARLDKFGKNLQWTGRQLEYNFTLPLVLAGAASTKWALDNERAATSIRKVYGDLGDDAAMLDAELKALGTSFELLSSRYGVVQSEVIGIGAAWAQAGAQGVAVAKATRLTLDAMILGEMEAIEATNGVIAVQSAYRLNTDQLKEALADLNIVENQTAIGFHGLIDVITRAGGTARTAGIDIEHLAAMAASLVPATGSAAQAGNALRTMISRLMAPTKEASELLAKMGIDVHDASWQALNGVGRIEKMAESFDKLTQSQKAVVSSAVASRWQINRFDILMEDIAKNLDEATQGQSAYGRALEATSDQARSNAVYAKELATVLASSPRAFSILTRTIQNSMAKAILPLLPAIVGVLAEIAKAVQWFANLSPEVQKTALMFLVLLAAVGPLSRYIGSFVLLFTTLGHVVHFLTIGLWKLASGFGGVAIAAIKGIWGIAKLPFAAIGMLMELMWQGFVLGTKFALASLGIFGRALLSLIPVLRGAISAMILTVHTVFAAGIRTAMSVAVASLSVGLTAIRTVAMGFFSGLGTLFVGGFTKIFILVRTIFMGGIIPFLLTAGKAMVAALTGPWGLIALAVIALAVIFRKQIGAAVQWVIDAFNKLPESVVRIFQSLIRIVKTAALAIYEWLSYINPFSRHSPSLVESVRAGVATILDEYSRLSGISGVIRRAIDAMEDFKSATGGGLESFRMGEFQEQKADIVAVAPGASGEVDRMIASIFELYDALDLVNLQIREQTRLVDDMTARIDSGLKPYNDAIFENEMAQKRLRLELLKMEQAGGSIDDIKDKMAALSGEIEKLRGDQTELRMAGAGSDVLGFYDQQIAALEAQRKAMMGITAPADELTKQLDELQRQGEILQLEKDIQFDPQLRALEEQEKKLRDLQSAYSDINSLINDMEGALREMSSAAAEATKKAGQSNAEALFDAAAAGDFEVPGGDAPPGLGREGGLAEIEAFNKALEDELAAALDGMGGMDLFKPIKDMWNKAWGWIKETIGPIVGPIFDKVSSFMQEHGIDWDFFLKGGLLGEGIAKIGELLSGAGLGGIFDASKEYFNTWWGMVKDVWNFLVEFFGPVFEWLGDQIGKATKAIGGELKNWEPLFGEAIEAIGHIANVVVWAFKNVIVPIIKVSLGIILGIWKLVWPILKAVLTPIIDFIIGIIRGGLEIIRGIITVVLGVINGEWGRVWEGIATIIDGVWDRIWETISLSFTLVYNFVKTMLEGIVGFFMWLWDKVGKHIVPILVEGVIFYFVLLKDTLVKVWDLLWTGIEKLWNLIGVPIFTGIKWVIENILIPAFNHAQTILPPIFSAIGGALKWVFDHIISPVFEAIKTGIGKVGDAFAWVKDHVISPVWDAISGIISRAWDGIANILEAGVNFFITAFNLLAGAINAVANALGLGFRVPTFGRVSVRGGGGGGPRGGPGSELYAAGGIPARDFGGPGFKTKSPIAIVGEGSRMFPEYVIPTDPKYRGNALRLLSQLGAEMFAVGGIPNPLNAVGDAAGAVAGGVMDVGSAVADKVVGGAKSFFSIIERVRTMIREMLSFLGDIARTVVDQVYEWGKNGVVNTAKGIRDAAWNVGAVINPVDDIMNLVPGLARGGIVAPRPGGTLVRLGEGGRHEAVQPLPADWNNGVQKTYNFYGDLEFPNVRSGEDAEEFIRNLETLVSA